MHRTSLLTITQGDQVTFNLTAFNSGTPVDLTSAIFTTQILGPQPGNMPTIFPNSQHTANPDQVNFKGQFTLALSPADTASLRVFSGLEILTLILLGGATPLYFHGPHLLTVLPNIPRL